jgi:hypothetical protein
VARNRVVEVRREAELVKEIALHAIFRKTKQSLAITFETCGAMPVKRELTERKLPAPEKHELINSRAYEYRTSSGLSVNLRCQVA